MEFPGQNRKTLPVALAVLRVSRAGVTRCGAEKRMVQRRVAGQLEPWPRQHSPRQLLPGPWATSSKVLQPPSLSKTWKESLTQGFTKSVIQVSWEELNPYYRTKPTYYQLLDRKHTCSTTAENSACRELCLQQHCPAPRPQEEDL